MDIIDVIVNFNKDAGLLEKGYSDFLESSFQIEEALEGFSFASLDSALYGDASITPLTAKAMSRGIVNLCYDSTQPLADVNRLDKACDAFVFAVGSMAKLGLTADQIRHSLAIVMHKNMQKLTMPKDQYGKLLKPDNFEGPEPELQRILDQRR